MKVLAAIADFKGRKTTPIVKQNLEKFGFKVLTFSTSSGEFIFDESIGEDLPFQHRSLFAEEKNNYDYFFFTENDIEYPESTINILFNEFNTFGKDLPLGLIRHEEEQLIDFAAVLNGPKIVKKTNDYFIAKNDHQACYILNKYQLNKAIDSGNYLINPSIRNNGTQIYGKLETAASNVYYECGLRKAYPHKNLESLLIRHMDLKWKYMQPRFTINDLYKELYDTRIL